MSDGTVLLDEYIHDWIFVAAARLAVVVALVCRPSRGQQSQRIPASGLLELAKRTGVG